jgi:uncharacterized membrane protein YqjE
MSDTRPPGPAASLRALASTLVDVLRTRLELLAIEGTQYQRRLGRLALLAAFGLVSLALCLQLSVGLVIALVWDTPYRLSAIAALAMLFAAGAAGIALMLARQLRAAPPALDGTLRALATDLEGLS